MLFTGFTEDVDSICSQSLFTLSLGHTVVAVIERGEGHLFMYDWWTVVGKIAVVNVETVTEFLPSIETCEKYGELNKYKETIF